MNPIYELLAVARDSIERVMLASDRLDDDSLRDQARDLCCRAGRLEMAVPDEIKVSGPRPMSPLTKEGS